MCFEKVALKCLKTDLKYPVAISLNLYFLLIFLLHIASLEECTYYRNKHYIKRLRDYSSWKTLCTATHTNTQKDKKKEDGR